MEYNRLICADSHNSRRSKPQKPLKGEIPSEGGVFCVSYYGRGDEGAFHQVGGSRKGLPEG